MSPDSAPCHRHFICRVTRTPRPEAQIAHSVLGHLLPSRSSHPRFGGIRRTYLGVSRIRFCVCRTALVVHFRIHCIALVAPRLAFVALGLWH
jgi:hypothetical protein